MRAISRSRRLPSRPVPFRAPLPKAAVPKNKNGPHGPPQKTKSPTGGFSLLLARGRRAPTIAATPATRPRTAGSRVGGRAFYRKRAPPRETAARTCAFGPPGPSTLDLYRQARPDHASMGALTRRFKGSPQPPCPCPRLPRATAGEALRARAHRRRHAARRRAGALGERAGARAGRVAHDREPGAEGAHRGRGAGARRRRRHLRRRAARARPSARGAQHRR